jgi:hypothetical protein
MADGKTSKGSYRSKNLSATSGAKKFAMAASC